MSASDHPRSPAGSAPDPQPDFVALALGQLPPAEAEALRARAAADPALRREQREVERLFGALRAAFDPAPDPAASERVVERVRARVREESRPTTRARRPAGRRLVFGRFLAWSLAAHAAAIGFIVLRSPPPEEKATESIRISAMLRDPQLRDWAADRDAIPPGSPWAPPSVDVSVVGSELVLRDPIVPTLEIPIRGALADDPLSLPDLRDRLRGYPPGVAVEMLARTDDAYKRARLEHLDLDPDGTLTRVRRGLDALARLQRPDGSFPAAPEANVPGAAARDEVAETSLALLPFLGEGRGSKGRTSTADVAARGIAWLRARLFGADGEGRPDASVLPRDLGVALAALSEDYMVSYGRLAPGEAQRRAQELKVLAERITAAQTKDGSFPDVAVDSAEAAVWAMWGLDAAVRTGVVAPPSGTAERFAAWYAARPKTADGLPSRPDGTPDPLLAAAALLLSRDLPAGAGDGARREAAWVQATPLPQDEGSLYLAAAGSGLLRVDPSGYRAWTHDQFARIAERLDPTGVARRGDPVGDSALILLALQAAYRTF